MVTVPSFLLRRLYVKESLCNTDRGLQFQLMNRLGTGYARRLLPLALDGQQVPLERCTFSINGKEFPFSTVSNEMPFTLDLNRTTTITIKDVTLSDEPHRISMGFEVAGLGILQFDFTDVPSESRGLGHGERG